MRNFKLLTIGLVGIATTFSCDLIPSKPDFTTSHKVEAPILLNKEYQFLGGGGTSEVLIDTTGNEFDSLFTIDPTSSLISLSIEEEFDFGDLNDAIPEISTDETSFNSQVGELEIGSFSSGSGNLGTASFQDLTGLNPALVPAGTPIPGGTTPAPVNIDVGSSTDFFVSATIKRGSIDLSLTNNLGFDIDAIDVDLNSGGSFVAGTTINNVNHGTSSTGSIPFNEGDVLSDINIDVSVTWLAQNTQAVPGELIVEGINGNGLAASAVEAALESQNFSTSNTTIFDAAEFQFTSADHYVQLESGTINIAPIVNGLDLTIDSLIISFPNIRRGPNYLPGDSLRIRYIPGFDQILRDDIAPAKERDLTGFRLYALNNEIEYNIYAITENTQNAAPGDQTRTISETDEISSSVTITNLVIGEAFGEILPQNVLLGDNDPANDDVLNNIEIVDLFNETEVEVISIDGLEDISSQIKGLEFTQASLSINYETDIGVPTTLYAAFLGVNGDGEEVYLSGKSGTNAEVLPTDPITGLSVNGVQIPADSLIKFELQTSNSGLQMFSLTFDSTNSTVNEFLNNLPSEIRFVGKAVVNEDGGEATIATPLNFDPAFVVDLPLAFRTTELTVFEDTTDVGVFESFPAPDDDANLTEGTINIKYSNGLPLGFSIGLIFADSLGNQITTLPIDVPTGGKYDLNGALVDATSRFATTPTDGIIEISLTDQQLSDLYRASQMIIESNLRTTQNTEVRFRATDSIRLTITAKIAIETNVSF